MYRPTNETGNPAQLHSGASGQTTFADWLAARLHGKYNLTEEHPGSDKGATDEPIAAQGSENLRRPTSGKGV